MAVIKPTVVTFHNYTDGSIGILISWLIIPSGKLTSLAGISPCFIGKSSSIRVHFPASVFQLIPEGKMEESSPNKFSSCMDTILPSKGWVHHSIETTHFKRHVLYLDLLGNSVVG